MTQLGNRRLIAKSSYLKYLQSTSPICLWPLDDPDTVARNYGTLGSAANGTHTGVTPGQPGIAGRASAFYDGANDYSSVGSVGLFAAAPYTQITVAGWTKMSSAAPWTDNSHDLVFLYMMNGPNYFQVWKKNTNNTFSAAFTFAGVTKVADATLSTTNWFHWAAVLDKTANTGKLYINGTQQGDTQTNLGVPAGAPATALIGAADTVPNNELSGWAQFISLWNRPLSAPEVSVLYTKAFA